MLKQLLIVALMVGAVACGDESYSKQEENEASYAGENAYYDSSAEAAQGPADGAAPVSEARQGFTNLKNRLSELATHAGRSAMRSYEGAKPTLGQIRQNLGDSYEQIKTHPRVVGGQEWLKPRYEAARGAAAEQYRRGKEFVVPKYESFKTVAMPAVEGGSKRVGSVMGRIGSKIQEVRKNGFASFRGAAAAAADNQAEATTTVAPAEEVHSDALPPYWF